MSTRNLRVVLKVPSNSTVRHEQPVTLQDISVAHKSGCGSGCGES